MAVGQTFGQSNNGNSPYSRFGLGDIVDQNFINSRNMGGLGNSLFDGYRINIVNPASYASLKATAFELGVTGTRSTYSTDEASRTSWDGNLQYFALGFPLSNPLNEVLDQKKRPFDIGMSFALIPNSTVGYNIESTEDDPDLGLITRRFEGDGGSFNFQWGNAIKYKNFSFGVNLGYVFGGIENERSVVFQEVPAVYQTLFSNNYSLRGFYLNTGILYNKVLNEKKILDKVDKEPVMISLGFTFTPPSNFNTNATNSQLGIQDLVVGNDIDTLSFQQDVTGNGRLPLRLGLGANYYYKEKYMIGIDFSLANWSSYENDADDTVVNNPLKNTFNVALGGFYRPNYRSFNNYFERIYYRYGVYYESDPRQINNEQLDAYGVSFGLGLPFIYQRGISHADIGVELGQRGAGSVIEETFLTINVGFTFNDSQWFLKSKYN